MRHASVSVAVALLQVAVSGRAQEIPTERSSPRVPSVVVHLLALETEAGTPLESLVCAEVEVLEAFDDGRSSVRLLSRRFERADRPARSRVGDIAFTRTELVRASWQLCPPRVTTALPVPKHWAVPDPEAPARARISGTVFWNQGDGCKRWTFAMRGQRQLRLEHFEHRRDSARGFMEEWTYFLLLPGDASYTFAAVQTQTHESGGGVGGVGRSLSHPIGIVRATSSSITWIAAWPTVVAYHPDDAETWYRSRAACVRATAQGRNFTTRQTVAPPSVRSTAAPQPM